MFYNKNPDSNLTFIFCDSGATFRFSILNKPCVKHSFNSVTLTAVRVTVLKRFTLGLLKTENPKVVETCLGTLRRPHDLSTTQQDGSKACNSPRMVPVITFSFFTTIIPCKVGTKNTKSMKCHQIRRFCWLRLKTHKGEMKILCILAQQKWFQKSFFS